MDFSGIWQKQVKHSVALQMTNKPVLMEKFIEKFLLHKNLVAWKSQMASPNWKGLKTVQDLAFVFLDFFLRTPYRWYADPRPVSFNLTVFRVVYWMMSFWCESFSTTVDLRKDRLVFRQNTKNELPDFYCKNKKRWWEMHKLCLLWFGNQLMSF